MVDTLIYRILPLSIFKLNVETSPFLHLQQLLLRPFGSSLVVKAQQIKYIQLPGDIQQHTI